MEGVFQEETIVTNNREQKQKVLTPRQEDSGLVTKVP